MTDKYIARLGTLRSEARFCKRKPRDSRGVQRRLKPMRMTKELRLCKIMVDLPVNEKIHNRRTLNARAK